MFALVLIGLGATFLYLSNQNQQLLAKPISFNFAVVGAFLCAGVGFFDLYQHAQDAGGFLVALFQAIAMMSLVFMMLPVLGGFYASQSTLIKTGFKTAMTDVNKGLSSAQKYG